MSALVVSASSIDMGPRRVFYLGASSRFAVAVAPEAQGIQLGASSHAGLCVRFVCALPSAFIT